MITTTAHGKLKAYLELLVKEGQYVINGVTKKTPIFKTEKSGDEITFYLYLDDGVSGTITKFQLVDVEGDIFDDEPDNVVKQSTKGLLVVFRYSLRRL